MTLLIHFHGLTAVEIQLLPCCYHVKVLPCSKSCHGICCSRFIAAFTAVNLLLLLLSTGNAIFVGILLYLFLLPFSFYSATAVVYGAAGTLRVHQLRKGHGEIFKIIVFKSWCCKKVDPLFCVVFPSPLLDEEETPSIIACL